MHSEHEFASQAWHRQLSLATTLQRLLTAESLYACWFATLWHRTKRVGQPPDTYRSTAISPNTDRSAPTIFFVCSCDSRPLRRQHTHVSVFVSLVCAPKQHQEKCKCLGYVASASISGTQLPSWAGSTLGEENGKG